MDLAVKWRFFRRLLGGNDPEAERVYRWHIEKRSGPRMHLGLATDQWKSSVDDYVIAARKLCDSMRAYGFQPDGAIPVDPNRELLGGAHRLACAIALSIPWVSVVELPRMVWAPPWHLEWFVEHGMTSSDLKRLEQDWELLHW